MNVKLYNDTVNIEFNAGSHRYKVDGKLAVGVSTVLNVLHKDLMNWAAWMAAEAFKEAVMPFATTTEKTTKVNLKKLADDAKKAHLRKSQYGKDVGTIAHEWIKEETDSGQQVDLPRYAMELISQDQSDIQLINENTEAARHCVKQWRQWMIDYDIEIIKSEFIVHSKKLGYCGTCDVLYKSRRTGKVYMGDYKTSEPQKIRHWKTYAITGYKPYPEHFVQITAYDYANHEEYQFEPDGYTVIYLPKEGSYQTFSRENVTEDRGNWEHLFRTYKWIDGIKKTK